MIVNSIDSFIEGERFGGEEVQFDAFGALPKSDTVVALGHHPTVLPLRDRPHANICLET